MILGFAAFEETEVLVNIDLVDSSVGVPEKNNYFSSETKQKQMKSKAEQPCFEMIWRNAK